MNARPQHRRIDRGGFTLLELLLALSLTVVVLMLVNMAVDFHMRSLDARRTQLEESQLARSILRMIADDLRGAVQHYEQDMSEIEKVLQQSLSSAAGNAAAALGGGGDAGGVPGAGGEREGGEGGVELGGGALEGGGAGSGFSSAGSFSQAPSAANSLDPSGMTAGAESTSMNTADLSTAAIPAVPGLFGNQFQLQVDVSRLPRIEEYQRYLTADAATAVVDIPSDVKTVTYFVQTTAAAAGLGASQPLQDLTDPNASGTGLVRRVLDRSVTQWAMNNGNYTGLENSGELIAPEVAAIEFQYFDGFEWLPEWDTEIQQKLPLAVLVILALRSPGSIATEEVIPSNLTAETAADLRLYRMLVHLPAGQISSGEEGDIGTMGGDTFSGSATSSGGVP